VAVEPEHELLVRHFLSWAGQKGRHPDRELLGELLRLRSSYDDLGPTYWPEGSIEHLLLERWPSKGDIATPDEEVVIETLDAFVRFLRGSGRMSGRSAAPAVLGKEARRAARQMSEVAADRTNWSSGKVLLDFGRSMGIDLDDAPDIETLQSRLDQVQSMWNALPMVERRRLMPRPGDEADESEDLSEEERAMRTFRLDDPLLALVATYGHRLPEGDLPSADEVAPYFSRAPFLQQVVALAEWVGDGREITNTGVLRPAVAREAYAELKLGSWQRGQLERRYPDERYPGVAAVGRERWIEQELNRPWRSAAECAELDRLWRGALGCGLIRLEGKHAFGRASSEPSAEQWKDLGLRAAVAALDPILDNEYLATFVLMALLESYVNGRQPVDKATITEAAVRWQRQPSEIEGARAHEIDLVQLARPTLEDTLGRLDGMGLVEEDAESVALTPAGDLFVATWLTFLEQELKA
jgi:hypothetical protein